MLFSYFRNDGQLEKKVAWKNGKRNGSYTAYYGNGNKKYQKNFLDGKQNGKSIFYDKKGNIKKEELWQDGKVIKPEETKKAEEA